MFQWRSSRMFSYGLVGIQGCCLAIILITGPWIARSPWMLAVEAGGVALGLWALIAMPRGSFAVLPDVRPTCQLATHGPYRYVRHPMYTAVLLATAALVIDTWSIGRGITWAILCADLLVKLSAEEQALQARFPEYATYRRRTARLVPFVF
ncbi:MAG: isoprenylcysteine carboxylmethyltransferase family protein [Nitrospirae bacterium]|nr:MAG: isoprenylcysteine carboxylmethyltransferase family protein [Nitrospirota bacterium]